MDLFPQFVVIKLPTQSQIISHTSFDLTEPNQFKFIFTIDHYDFRKQYKSVYQTEITVSLP